MERHEEMLSPEEQYAQLAPTLDTDGFSLYAAAEEITGLKVYEEFPYEDIMECAAGYTEFDNELVRQVIQKITVEDAETIHIHFRDSDVVLEQEVE